MSKTSNFALRTFPEFKEAAQAMAARRLLHEYHAAPDGGELTSYLDIGSVNSAFNTLIAKGLPPVLAIVDRELALAQGCLDIAQDIMRFLLGHPAARRAMAANFPPGSPAHQVLSEVDAGNREAEEKEGEINDAGNGLTGAERKVFEDFLNSTAEDGISREMAARELAQYQQDVEQLTTCKGALQRAMATQGEHGSRAPA